MNKKHISARLRKLGITDIHEGVCTGTRWHVTQGEVLTSYSPVDSEAIGRVRQGSPDDYETVMGMAVKAFEEWRSIPAPRRGEVVRQIGQALRDAKEDLGFLVTLETGKILQEGLGEVQEMIDICDFAVGQSRLLSGITMHSERPEHRMYEQYQPLGVVGLITSFNFPVAVWAWNAMIAAVAGDIVIWKPSSKTPLTAVATHHIIAGVLKKNKVPEGVFNLFIARSDILGDRFLTDTRIPLISVTGSTAVGRHVSGIVGARLGRTICELGGNNAIIVSSHADLDMAIPAILFGAVGTAGQRCTTTRRLIVQEKVYEEVKKRLIKAYEQVSRRIGNPFDPSVLVGPLIDQQAVKNFRNALKELKKQGGRILFGGEVLSGSIYKNGLYVVPTIAQAENHYKIVQEETFAPILYLMKYKTIEEAIHLNNSVPQGLSSAIFTLHVREAEKFLSEAGSDCGIANVNIGTSGAEIGGAFGGEKDTGGGRESGSDAWKSYMRRQTNTINFGTALPLAQGIRFEL